MFANDTQRVMFAARQRATIYAFCVVVCGDVVLVDNHQRVTPLLAVSWFALT